MTIDLNWDAIEACVKDLELQIRKDHTITSGMTCIGITNGGVIPAMLLAKRLGCGFDVINMTETITAKRIFSYSKPIVVDDIVDSGETMMQLMNTMRAHPTFTFYTAALVRKKKSHLGCDYIAILTADDAWYTFPWEYDEIEKRGRDIEKKS